VIGERAYDEDDHKNTQFLEATGTGPFPREMQKAWGELRDEAADNYGCREGFQEEEVKDKMWPLAEPTPVVIRNKEAAERTRSRRVEAFGAERNETVARAAREGGTSRGEEDAQRQQEEGVYSEEDMDGRMEAMVHTSYLADGTRGGIGPSRGYKKGNVDQGGISGDRGSVDQGEGGGG
jgi:hypothetical protein